ncbi:MAG TPA: potassium transporter Kup, partial [Candidatus Omnitrophota bacterium]|nr:potassium transporter Kup [Candidatus Omnitrophota bacterium]
GIHSLYLRYGFLEEADVPGTLVAHGYLKDRRDLMRVSFFVSRENLIPSEDPSLPPWQERLFVLLTNGSLSATDFFCLPPDRVVEMGTLLRV